MRDSRTMPDSTPRKVGAELTVFRSAAAERLCDRQSAQASRSPVMRRVPGGRSGEAVHRGVRLSRRLRVRFGEGQQSDVDSVRCPHRCFARGVAPFTPVVAAGAMAPGTRDNREQMTRRGIIPDPTETGAFETAHCGTSSRVGIAGRSTTNSRVRSPRLTLTVSETSVVDIHKP